MAKFGPSSRLRRSKRKDKEIEIQNLNKIEATSTKDSTKTGTINNDSLFNNILSTSRVGDIDNDLSHKIKSNLHEKINSIDNKTEPTNVNDVKKVKHKHKHINWNANIIQYVKSNINKKSIVYGPIKPIAKEIIDVSSDSSFSSNNDSNNSSVQGSPKAGIIHQDNAENPSMFDNNNDAIVKPVIPFDVFGTVSDNKSRVDMFGNKNADTPKFPIFANTISDKNKNEQENKEQFRSNTFSSFKRTFDKTRDINNPRDKFNMSPDKKCRKIDFSNFSSRKSNKVSLNSLLAETNITFNSTNVLAKNKKISNCDKNLDIKFKLGKEPMIKYIQRKHNFKKKLSGKNNYGKNGKPKNLFKNLVTNAIKSLDLISNVKKSRVKKAHAKKAEVKESDVKISMISKTIKDVISSKMMKDKTILQNQQAAVSDGGEEPTNTIELEKSIRIKLIESRRLRQLAEEKKEQLVVMSDPPPPSTEPIHQSKLRKLTKTSNKKTRPTRNPRISKKNKVNNRVKKFINQQCKLSSKKQLFDFVKQQNNVTGRTSIPRPKNLLTIKTKPETIKIDKSKLSRENKYFLVKKLLVPQTPTGPEAAIENKLIAIRKKQLLLRKQQLEVNSPNDAKDLADKQKKLVFQKKLLVVALKHCVGKTSGSFTQPREQLDAAGTPCEHRVEELKRLIVAKARQIRSREKAGDSNAVKFPPPREQGKVARAGDKHLSRSDMQQSAVVEKYKERAAAAKKKEAAVSKTSRTKTSSEKSSHISSARKQQVALSSNHQLERHRRRRILTAQREFEVNGFKVSGNITYLTHEYPWGRPNYRWWVKSSTKGERRSAQSDRQMTSLVRYFKGLKMAIAKLDGIKIAKYLSLRDLHIKDRYLHSEHLKAICNFSLKRPWNRIALRHLRCIEMLQTHRYYEIFLMYFKNYKLFFMYLKRQEGNLKRNWFLPILVMMSNELRMVSIKADMICEKFTAFTSQFIQHEPGRCLETLVAEMMRIYRYCATDMRTKLENSKRLAMLPLTNCLLRIYIWIDKMVLCRAVIRAIDHVKIKDHFEKKEMSTYYYFCGKRNMHFSEFDNAEENLLYAFKHGDRRYINNMGKILSCLIPLKILHGIYPGFKYLRKYRLEKFIPICRAIRNGNIGKLNSIFVQEKELVISSNMHVLWPEIFIYTFRNLLKSVAVATDSSRVRIANVYKALQFTKCYDISENEVLHLCSLLIQAKRIKGYVSVNKMTMVILKRNFPNGAFPEFKYHV